MAFNPSLKATWGTGAKKVFVVLFLILASGAGLSAKSFAATSEAKNFVHSLMQKMTLEEKIGQLNLLTSDMDQTGASIRENYRKYIQEGKVGSIFNAYTPEFTRKLQEEALKTRLKIPLIFGYDVIHGHRTIFPIPLAEASSWNLELMEKTAQIAAKEAAADGIHWTYSPMVDISRDPRWGRIAEGAGEDPWLGSAIARAKVRGYQGTNLSDPNSILACVKHLALYGGAEGGRDYNAVDMSLHRMFETYLPPYEAAVRAGAATVMTSFNTLNGVPATANTWLFQDLLRKQWGFQGFIVTDYTSIKELEPHNVAADDTHAGLLAMKASVDMDMQSEIYLKELPKLVKNKKVSITQIDQAVERILLAKYHLGLFKDPFRQTSPEKAKNTLMSEEHLNIARKMAQRSVVLLQNKKQILPLKKETQIALIGPLAQSKRDLIGNWSAAGDWKKSISVEEGLKASGLYSIQYEKGANLSDDPELVRKLNEHKGMIEIDSRTPDEMIKDAVKIAKKADVVVAVLGESQGMSGEAASRAFIGLPESQSRLLKALVETKTPVVLVLMNGRPLTLTWEDENVAAILETWFLGTVAGDAIADVLSGEVNPSGRLPVSFPRSIGQIPIYYAAEHTGRPMDPHQKYSSKYLDEKNEPLYPFGYGLSYTTFKYGKIDLSKTRMSPKEKIKAWIEVKNTGSREAEETVQLYLQDLVASMSRPIKELKNFKKVNLAPGESKKVEFEISVDDLKFYDKDLKKIYEPGQFKVMIGPNSQVVDGALFELTAR